MLMNQIWVEECSEPYSMGRSKNTEFFDVAVVVVTIAATALRVC